MKRLNRTEYSGIISAPSAGYEYQYRTVSIRHFADLQEDIDRPRREGRLSEAATFRSYLRDKKFALPEDFPQARFVIILAAFTPPMRVNFQTGNGRVTACMPPGYYETGLTEDLLLAEIRKKVLPGDGYRLRGMSDNYHLKLLAVRSGLGQYGRNNICYVPGMGSFLTLHAFLTDAPFEQDHWGELQMLGRCKNCRLCITQCPGGAIREAVFVVDVSRCITLYNEVQGELPGWFPSGSHHAYMGCMQCQALCPANREAMQRAGQLEDITEEETRQIVNGHLDETVILSISRKLKVPYLAGSPELVGVASRNIKALLQSKGTVKAAA